MRISISLFLPSRHHGIIGLALDLPNKYMSIGIELWHGDNRKVKAWANIEDNTLPF